MVIGRSVLVAVCLILAMLPAIAGAATHARSGAKSPVAAVKAIATSMKAGNIARCAVSSRCVPETKRLIKRLHSIRKYELAHAVVEALNPLSRAQNVAQRNTYTVLSNDGKTAQVQWTQFFLPPFDLTFVVKHSSSGWRIDDSYCSGQPSTSLYLKPQPFVCDSG